MVNKELLKTAAQTLRNLSRERNEAVEKLARYQKAEELIQKMSHTQEFAGEEIFQKIAEFKQRSLTELETANQSLALIKGCSLKLGSLSETPAPGGEIDNLTYYLIYGDSN